MESVIEVQQEPKKRGGVPFTKENAAAMAQRGRERKAAREAEARRIVELGAQNEAQYRNEQTTRVRAHIERLHRKIETCNDPKELHFLSQCLKNIAEIEARLRSPSGPSPSIKRGALGSGPLES